MAEPLTTLEEKLGFAAMAVLSDGGIEDLATIYLGQEFEEQQTPCVIVNVEPGEEDVPDSGTYVCTLEFICKSSMDKPADEATTDDSRDTAGNLAQTVRELVLVDDLAELLTAACDDFTAFLVRNLAPARSREGRLSITTLRMEVVCCPSRIS
jgi:hypothetical protein